MKVVLYATITCPTCKALEELMKKKNIDFEVKLLEKSENMIEMLMLGSSTPNTQRWSTPVLSVDGKFIESGKEIEWIESVKN